MEFMAQEQIPKKCSKKATACVGGKVFICSGSSSCFPDLMFVVSVWDRWRPSETACPCPGWPRKEAHLYSTCQTPAAASSCSSGGAAGEELCNQLRDWGMGGRGEDREKRERGEGGKGKEREREREREREKGGREGGRVREKHRARLDSTCISTQSKPNKFS